MAIRWVNLGAESSCPAPARNLRKRGVESRSYRSDDCHTHCASMAARYWLTHTIPVGAEHAREEARTSAKSLEDACDPSRPGLSREEAGLRATKPRGVMPDVFPAKAGPTFGQCRL